MLPTDWSSPSSWVLARLSDSRAQQFWDENHLVAKQVAADARAPQPVPECCDESGIPWDVAALYPKGAVWTDRLPSAVFFAGPVVKFESALQTKLVEVLSSDQATLTEHFIRNASFKSGAQDFGLPLFNMLSVSIFLERHGV